MLGNGKRIWQPTAMQERKSLRMNKEQKQFLLSSLFSGIMIGIGCTVYLSCVNKLVGALLFCAGLFFILTNGGTLFTGICGLKTPVKKLAWVFVLNGLGTVIPAIVSWSNVVDGATKLGATAAAVMLGKLSMNPVSWLLNGLMCGVLMYLAVIGYKKAKDSLHGIAAVLFAIVGFIVCGFEHSIADMGYLAIAIPNLSFWQILQCMGMILVIMLGNVFGGKLMRMVLVDWQEEGAEGSRINTRKLYAVVTNSIARKGSRGGLRPFSSAPCRVQRQRLWWGLGRSPGRRSIMQEKYAQLALENTVRLLGIDSPSGYTENAAKYVQAQFAKMGYDAKITRKGGVLIDLGGEDAQDALLLEAHTDTLGGMVAQIKGNGRLRITNVGGMNANNAEAENVRVITKFSGAIDGTVQLCDASVHVNGNYSTTPRTFDTVEVVLDEDVRSAEDVRKLGIDVGDFVCFDPRSRITESGYIKSRFLDDKLSVGILQAFAQYLKDENLTPKRRVYVHVTVYEEVGHGGSASVPDGVTEAISVDMGCVGEGVQCTERQVSICAKDSGGPYSYDVVRKLIAAAKREGADYAVDVYPHYGSDVEATLRAGYDIRHGLIGAGVYASHGYERSHRDGALNTLKVIEGYLFE